MESGSGRKPEPVTWLAPMLGNWFAVTRRGRKLDIRKLPNPKPGTGPAEVVQLPLPFPARRER